MSWRERFSALWHVFKPAPADDEWTDYILANADRTSIESINRETYYVVTHKGEMK